MKVIDCNTGLELREGMSFDNVDGHIEVLKVYPGLFKASIDLKINGKKCKNTPLIVRWTHPSFFFQHIAFLPS